MDTPPTGEFASHRVLPYPSQVELLSVLLYDPETGVLRWRLDAPTPNPHISPIRFSSAKVPIPIVYVLGRTLRANRVCFTLAGGTLPRSGWVKHLNGKEMDFRATNMVAVSPRPLVG